MSLNNQIRSIFLCICASILMSCEHDADQYPIKGIDISHYQEDIDWKTVSSNKDLHFVFMKATEGGDYQDSTFRHNWAAARNANLKRGAYHFFRTKASAEQQIQNFKSLVQLQKGDLPPVLDIEDVGPMPNPKVLEKIKTWLIFIEAHYEIRPIIYASVKFYQQHLKAAFPDYKVWIARYSRHQPPKEHQWLFWQFSNEEYVQGIDPAVDMNVFSGTLEELDAL